ncbi:MAG: Hsp20/alpha crystallin family protein [Syntrophobacteraceae bacterium]|nr:Hsp20/alpha crystallin family protein [Desulfobacteraceae bacterium]
MSNNVTNPLLNELHSMKRKMDALYLQSFSADDAASPAETPDSPDWQPAIDIWQTPAEWILVADLPGVADSELHVHLVDSKLTIQGHREAAPCRDGAEPFQRERPNGSFTRTFMLTQDIQEDSISAEFKRGVLTVVIPKITAQSGPPHRIAVHSA